MTEKRLIGWREWLALPDLDIPWIKVKVDTGARTSALHAFAIEPYHNDKGEWRIRFGIHPAQKASIPEVWCDAPIADRREVTDSGGHKELRYVIRTCFSLGAWQWEGEVTLTDRENMRFRMLLGRNAMKEFFLVDPSQSFLLGGDRFQPPYD
jgi:hypothetical protein